MSAASLLKTRARPTNQPSSMPPSTPASLMTAPPSGARLPRSSRRPPAGLHGARHGGGDAGGLFGQRLPGAGEAVAVEQPGFKQLADDHRQPALGVDIDHRVS